MAKENGDDERAAGKAELDGLRDAGEAERNGAENDTHHDTKEDGHEVGLVEGVVGVTYLLGKVLDVFNGAHAHESVSHLDVEVGACHHFHAGADDAGDAYAVCTAEMKVLEALAGEFGFGDSDAARDHVVVLAAPVGHMHGNFFSEDNPDAVHLMLGGDKEEFVAFFKDCVSGGENYVFAFHYAGNHKAAAELGDDIREFFPEDCGILNGHMHAAGVLFLVFGLLDQGEFFFLINAENSLEDNYHGYDAQNANGISHGIGRSQFFRGNAGGHGGGAGSRGDIHKGLLGGAKAGSVGDGAGHDAYHGGELFTGEGRNGPGYGHRQKDVHDGKDVHLHSPALEGMEEAGAHLEAY